MSTGGENDKGLSPHQKDTTEPVGVSVDESSDDDVPPNVSVEVNTRLLPLAIAVFLVGFGFLSLFAWKELKDTDPLLHIPKSFTETHYWPKGEVRVEWHVLRTDEIRERDDTRQVMCIARAEVFYGSDAESTVSPKTPLSIRNISLILKSDSGISVFEKSEALGWIKNVTLGPEYDYRIPFGESKETTLRFWVPLALFRDIEGLSARLGFSLEDEDGD